jgi:hypothetical protein
MRAPSTEPQSVLFRLTRYYGRVYPFLVDNLIYSKEPDRKEFR